MGALDLHSIRQLQIALRPFQGLDRRLFVDTENNRLGPFHPQIVVREQRPRVRDDPQGQQPVDSQRPDEGERRGYDDDYTPDYPGAFAAGSTQTRRQRHRRTG